MLHLRGCDQADRFAEQAGPLQNCGDGLIFISRCNGANAGHGCFFRQHADELAVGFVTGGKCCGGRRGISDD